MMLLQPVVQRDAGRVFRFAEFAQQLRGFRCLAFRALHALPRRQTRLVGDARQAQIRIVLPQG